MTELLPIVTAIVILLATWFKETFQRRGREQVRQRLVAQVKEEIGVIEAWATAHASCRSSSEPPPAVRERALRDLDTAYNRMQQFHPEPQEPVTLQIVVSHLFLRHLRVSWTVRGLRYIYYLALFMAFIWGLVGFSQPNSWSSVPASFATVTTYIIVAVLPALFVGWLTMYVSRRQATVSPSPVPAQ